MRRMQSLRRFSGRHLSGNAASRMRYGLFRLDISAGHFVWTLLSGLPITERTSTWEIRQKEKGHGVEDCC